MAVKGISLEDAKAVARREMVRPIRTHGFEQRELGKSIVNILYYSVEYAELTEREFRMTIFINGKSRAGVSL